MTEINNKLQKEATKAKELANLEYQGEINSLKEEIQKWRNIISESSNKEGVALINELHENEN